MNLEQFKELLKTGIFKDFIAGIDTLIKENPFLKQDIEQPEDDTEEDAPEKEEEKEDKKEDEKEEEKEVKKSSKKESNKENDDADDDADADEAEEDAEEKDTAEKALNFAAEAVNIAFDKEDRKRVAIAIRKYNIKSPALKWAGKIYKVAVAGYKAFGDEKQVAKVAPLLNVGGEILDDLANGVENAKFDIRNVTKLSSYITDHPQYRDDIAELYTQWQGEELKANTGNNSEFEPMEDELSVKDCLDQLMLNLERLKEKEPTRTQRDTDESYQKKLNTHLENQFKSFRNLNYLYFQYNRLMIKQTAEINNAIRNNKFEIDYYDDQAFRMAQNGKDLFFSIGQFLKNSYNFTDVNAEKETKDYETAKNEYKEQCKKSQNVINNYIKNNGTDTFNFKNVLSDQVNANLYPQLKTLIEKKGIITASDILNSPEILARDKNTNKNAVDVLEDLINEGLKKEQNDYEKKMRDCELLADGDYMAELNDEANRINAEYAVSQKEFESLKAEMTKRGIVPNSDNENYLKFAKELEEFNELKTSALKAGVQQSTISSLKNIVPDSLFENFGKEDFNKLLKDADEMLSAKKQNQKVLSENITKLEKANNNILNASLIYLEKIGEINKDIEAKQNEMQAISAMLEHKYDENQVSQVKQEYIDQYINLDIASTIKQNLLDAIAAKDQAVADLSVRVHQASFHVRVPDPLKDCIQAKINLCKVLETENKEAYDYYKKAFEELNTNKSITDPQGQSPSIQQGIIMDLSLIKSAVHKYYDKNNKEKKNFKLSKEAKKTLDTFETKLSALNNILNTVNNITPFKDQVADIHKKMDILYAGYKKKLDSLALEIEIDNRLIDETRERAEELKTISPEKQKEIDSNNKEIEELRVMGTSLQKEVDLINKAKNIINSGKGLFDEKVNAKDEKLKSQFHKVGQRLQERNNRLSALKKKLSEKWAPIKAQRLVDLHKEIDEPHIEKLASFMDARNELIEFQNSTLLVNSAINNLSQESLKMANAKNSFVAKKSEVLEQRTAQLEKLQGQFTKQINEVIKRVERSKKLFGISDSKYFKNVLQKIENYKNNSDAFSNNDWNMSSEEWKDKSEDLLKSLETYIAKREDADGERKHTQLGQQRLDAVKALRAAIMERTKLISNFDKEEIALKEQVKNPDDILPVEIMLQSRIKEKEAGRIYSDEELNKALISIAEKKSLEKAPEEELESLQDKIRMDEPEIKPIQINVPH